MKYEKLLTWLVCGIQSVITFFLPVVPLLALVGFFLFCDFLTAIAAAFKLREGFKLRALLDSIPKAIIYGVVVVVAYVVEINFFKGSNLSKLICGAVALRELKSIDRNCTVVLGKSLLTSVIVLFKAKSK